MSAKPTTIEQFAAAVTLAVALPSPSLIYRAIMAGTPEVDDGLRGTAYDGDRTSGGGGSSHVERQVERRNPGQFPTKDAKGNEDNWEAVRGQWDSRSHGLRAGDELLRLKRATDRAMEAISALNAECCDAGQPDTWEEAIQCANILEQQGYIQAAIDVGRNVDSAAMRFVHAIDTVRAVRDSWMAHAPAQGLAEANYAWCQSHGRIGAEEKRTTRKLCRWCWDQMADLAELGEPVVLQEDTANWPSEGMLRAMAEGRLVDVKRERNDWIRSRGLNPERVHQRRQMRRGA